MVTSLNTDCKYFYKMNFSNINLQHEIIQQNIMWLSMDTFFKCTYYVSHKIYLGDYFCVKREYWDFNYLFTHLSYNNTFKHNLILTGDV